MSREKNLIKNTAIISIGTFFPKFISILLTPILTAKLTDIQFGSYDLITTIAALLLPAATLQVSAAAFRFLIERRNDEKECKAIVSTIVFFTVLVSIPICLLFYATYGHRYGDTGILICLYFFFNILLITCQQIVRGLGKNLVYSISAMIFSAFDTLFVAILLGVFGNSNLGLDGVLFAMVCATCLSIFFLVLKEKIYTFFDFHAISNQKLKDMLKYSWPMVPNNMSDWVLRLSDRLVITGVLGVQANALYAAANKLPTIFSSFQTTFSLAWQENASIAAKDEDSNIYYSQMCDWIFKLLFGVLAILIASTPIIFRLLIRGNYQEAYPQLPVLYMGMLFSCMAATIGGIYIAFMKTKSAGISTMMAALLNLVIDFALIHQCGIWAGSISTMISYLCLLIFRMINVQSFAFIRFDLKKIISGICILVLMCFLCYLNTIVFIICNCGVAILVILAFDRDIIVSILARLRKRTMKKDDRK